MIPVVFPRSLNWFYEAQAVSIATDLSANGIEARAVASTQLEATDAEAVFLVSFAESLVAAERSGCELSFLAALKRIKRRILLNFDNLRSPWFKSHFSQGAAYFSEIFDVGLFRQIVDTEVEGVRYVFVPEAFSAAERESVVPWSEGRPVPWTVVGHETRDRSALIVAAMRGLAPHGFVFSPPLRPFTRTSGLDRGALARVLTRSDIYLWGSHHTHPYHETQRALHAVAAGAVPVKIDPLYSRQMALPWVYGSLKSFCDARDRNGLSGAYAQARDVIDRQGTIGANLKAALLGSDEAGPRGPRAYP